MTDSRDSHLIYRIVCNYASSTQRERVAQAAQHVNECLYVPSAYLNCGIKGATGDLAHYGANADLRDAAILEAL